MYKPKEFKAMLLSKWVEPHIWAKMTKVQKAKHKALFTQQNRKPINKINKFIKIFTLRKWVVDPAVWGRMSELQKADYNKFYHNKKSTRAKRLLIRKYKLLPLHFKLLSIKKLLKVGTRGFKFIKKLRKLYKNFKGKVDILQPRRDKSKTQFKFGKATPTNKPLLAGLNKTANKAIIWNTSLPIKYWLASNTYRVAVSMGNIAIFNGNVLLATVKISEYGSVVFLSDSEFSDATVKIERIKQIANKPVTNATIIEKNAISMYTKLYLQRVKISSKLPKIRMLPLKNLNSAQQTNEKKSYLKHIIRLRYRWFFKPKLAKFKLFKKFFKRTLKRFRKINKNKLFVDKFRNHFSRITGYKEKALFQMWLPFRKNYNQYWSNTNAVLRFSQSLILTPPSFLVFLRISPSLAASKFLVKSGAITSNGFNVTNLTIFKPGDIMQINMHIWKLCRSFFPYQRWNNDFRLLQYIPFLHIDWSSMVFMVVRWPRNYELVAPSFLSERWVRYYIRLFPARTTKFRKAKNNLKIYKRILTKQ